MEEIKEEERIAKERKVELVRIAALEKKRTNHINEQQKEFRLYSN